MKKWLVIQVVFIICLIPLLLLGDTTPIEAAPNFEEIFKDIANLVQNFKAMGLLGSISASILVIIKILKTDFVGGWFNKLQSGLRRALIITLGVISGIMLSIVGGMIWWQAIIAGLISSGGAIAIYEVFKPLFKKS